MLDLRKNNPSAAYGVSSLCTREPYTRRSSADSGFGLLPDGAWIATRYACPRRKRRESRKIVVTLQII